MATFKLPLSGDVVQAINPWQWTLNAAQGQWGLININLGRSAAPEVEARILDEVGSYGRQIGRISDVVHMLAARLDRSTLSDAEREQLDDFEQQMKQIRRIKSHR